MEHPTVFPRGAGPGSTGIASGFPTDLLGQSARRLSILAILYSTIFFLAGIFPALLFEEDRALLFSRPLLWAPPAAGIVLGIVVAVAVRSQRIPVHVTLTLGLIFEVVSSYAIAAAEFAEPGQIENHRGFLGLSWVAVWVLLFTVVVPTAPRRALVAALASITAVPAVILISTWSGLAHAHLNPAQFFFGLVFPYLLVVAMAYVGARVVYQLGTEVKRARELGSYRLEDKLGEGGMGEVWRASHRMLARPAAIKLIRPALSGIPGGVPDQAVQRFEREAQVIARLRSPHTVDLFDFGIASDGAFYYAMELLEGLDADSLVRKFGPLPPERVVHVLQQVCHSLSEAQSCGLVHRDIKPANIFLCRYGEEYDFVKVLDFGIVKAVVNAAETGPLQTGEHAINGTPAFMAPEQAMGEDVDGRTDIYSTGCVGYWLLTGKTVFTADSTLALLMQHARTPPTPPSERSGRAIPKALDDVVMSCLAKQPADRPQSAKELSRRLAAVHGAYGWTQEQAQTWWATHRTQS
jgi:serine/threonine-protein kinase